MAGHEFLREPTPSPPKGERLDFSRFSSGHTISVLAKPFSKEISKWLGHEFWASRVRGCGLNRRVGEDSRTAKQNDNERKLKK